MIGGAAAGPGARRVAVRVGGVLLAASGVVAWVLMMQAAARTLSFEPNSTQAMDASAAARVPALVWGLVLLAAALLVAFVTGHGWLALLGAPGLVVAAFVILAPGANGGALLWGFITSILGGGLALYLEGRRSLARRQGAVGARRT